MPRGYWNTTLRAILWKVMKILVGVALIVGALYSFVWVTGTFVNLKPGESPLLSPSQIRMTAITLSSIYSALVLIGKI